MKTVEEIAKTPNLVIEVNNETGGWGRIVYGSLKNCSVIWGRPDSFGLRERSKV